MFWPAAPAVRRGAARASDDVRRNRDRLEAEDAGVSREAPQRPQIHGAVVALRQNNLRREVVRRAAERERLGPVAAPQVLGEAKVRQLQIPARARSGSLFVWTFFFEGGGGGALDVQNVDEARSRPRQRPTVPGRRLAGPAGIQQTVLGLQVAPRDVVRVDVLEARRDARQIEARRAPRQPAARRALVRARALVEVAVQVAAVDVLHHQIRDVPVLERAAALGDERRRKTSDDGPFREQRPLLVRLHDRPLAHGLRASRLGLAGGRREFRRRLWSSVPAKKRLSAAASSSSSENERSARPADLHRHDLARRRLADEHSSEAAGPQQRPERQIPRLDVGHLLVLGPVALLLFRLAFAVRRLRDTPTEF